MQCILVKREMFKPYSHNEDYVEEYVWNDLDENMGK
jgi:hypothetical protein